MVLTALFALGLLAAAPMDSTADPAAPPAAVAQAATEDSGAGEDIPVGAPTDDYGFVAWCYGAVDEYLQIYEQVTPELKDIDKMFGTPVKEDEPYSSDIAAVRIALKRFGAALDAAERSNPQPIGVQGAADIQSGRSIWTVARMQPRRKLADAWLYWGIPKKCESASKALKSHAVERDQALAEAAPSSVALAGPEAPPLPHTADAQIPGGAPAAPQHAGAVLIDPK